MNDVVSKLKTIRVKALELNNSLTQLASVENPDIVITANGHPVGDAIIATQFCLVRLANKVKEEIDER